MGHPVINEIIRVFSVNQIQSHAFRRWQRVLKADIQPMLEDYARLKAENEELKAETATLRAFVDAHRIDVAAVRGDVASSLEHGALELDVKSRKRKAVAQ